MGRGKLGGTKAKIRGQVGSNIYQVKRGSDGQLVQSVYQKPENIQYSNSDAQAKARMVMGQIDRMFHALPSIINDAYKDTPRGALSFQHFAKINYEQLKIERDEHWNEIGDFDWRNKRDMTPPAGAWFLADGDYHNIQYDSLYVSYTTRNELNIIWRNVEETDTLADLLERMNLDIQDQIWFFYYIKQGPELTPSVEVIKFRFNPDYKLTDKLGDLDLQELWVPITPTVAQYSFALFFNGDLDFTVWDFYVREEYVIANGCLMIVNYAEDTTRFSTAQFRWLISRAQDIYPIQSPAQAFQSWASD